jgi:hypothetical protein
MDPSQAIAQDCKRRSLRIVLQAEWAQLHVGFVIAAVRDERGAAKGLTKNKQRFSETVTFGEICIYDMDAFDIARALRRDGINREDREQGMSYLGPLASETWIRVCMADWQFSSCGLGIEGRVSSDAVARAGLRLENFHFVLAQ